MVPGVLWCTSLPPTDDVVAQKHRVASWGGRVASFNEPGELRAEDFSAPRVEVVVLSRSGRQAVGKPVPLLADIFAHQRQAEHHVVGIINADVTLEATPQQRQWLEEAAQTSLVCVRRTDVVAPATPLAQGTQLPQGFDAFLYPKTLLDAVDGSGFCLGMPFWDLWLPAAATLAGVPVTFVRAPILRHVIHPSAWDDRAPLFMHMFAQALLAQAGRINAPVVQALLGNQAACLSALADAAGRDPGMVAVLYAVYDDFQVRVLGAVQNQAQDISAISV